MDRVTAYPLALPREEDILLGGKFAMVGLGGLSQAVLGTGPVADGFALTATTPASLSLGLAGGTVYQTQPIDATAWSSLDADTRVIVKQGVALDGQTLTFAPPGTAGYSQVHLIEVQYLDDDDNDTLLPYYNPDNPEETLWGPDGNGDEQPTARRGKVAVQVKPGIAAAAGSQTAPTPDAGWAPLWLVTLNAGQSQITAASIKKYPTAPLIETKLPAVPTDAQSGKWVYALATGTNALVATMFPVPAALPDGMLCNLVIANTNTGAVTFAPNGFPAAAIVRRDGQPLVSGDLFANTVMPLIRKGSVWRCLAPVASELASNLLTTPGSYELLNPDILLVKCLTGTTQLLQTLITDWKSYALNYVAQANFTGWTVNDPGAPTPFAVLLGAGTWDIFADGNGLRAGAFEIRIASTTNGTTFTELDRGMIRDSNVQGGDAVNVGSTLYSVITFNVPTYIVLQARKYSDNESGTSYMGDYAGVNGTFNAMLRCSRRKGIALI